LNSDTFLNIAIYYLYAIGIVFAFQSSYYYKNAIYSEKWLKCKGKVLESAIHKKKDLVLYTPKIKYEYSFNNITYFSDKVFWGYPIEVRRMINGGSVSLGEIYKINDTISIYVNPNKPKLSVLEPGVKWQTIYYLIIGWGFVLTALFIDFFMLFE